MGVFLVLRGRYTLGMGVGGQYLSPTLGNLRFYTNFRYVCYTSTLGEGDHKGHWCQVKEIVEKSRKCKQPETKGKMLIG